MKVYIAGKISGLPATEAERLFSLASIYLREMGHEVFDPFHENSGLVEDGTLTYEEVMSLDFLVIERWAEALYFLPNWHSSPGARREMVLARRLEKPCFFSLRDI